MERQAVRRIGIWIGALAVVFPVVALLAGSRTQTIVGIAVGGLLAALNFIAIERIASKVVRGSVRTQAILMGLLVLKMSALMVLVYFLVRKVGVDAVGFVIGLTTLVVGVLFEALRMAVRGEPRATSEATDG